MNSLIDTTNGGELATTAATPTKQVAQWDHFREQLTKLKATADTLTISDVNDKTGMALARQTRIAFKDIRCAVVAHHKQLKEDIVVEGRRLDKHKNELVAIIEPIEARLFEQERFAEVELEKLQGRKRQERLAELMPFLTMPPVIDLGLMSDEQYNEILTDSKSLHQARLDREEKERQIKAAAELAEKQERERVRLENEHLKKKAEEAQRKFVAERMAAEAERKQLQAEYDASMKQAQAKAEADRRAQQEANQKAQHQLNEQIRLSQIQINKVKAELLEKEAAEKQAKANQFAMQKASTTAPAKAKLATFQNAVMLALKPLLNESDPVMKEIVERTSRFVAWIGDKAKLIK